MLRFRWGSSRMLDYLLSIFSLSRWDVPMGDVAYDSACALYVLWAACKLSLGSNIIVSPDMEFGDGML